MVVKSNSELDAYEKEMADHDDGSESSVDQHSHAAIPDHDADTT